MHFPLSLFIYMLISFFPSCFILLINWFISLQSPVSFTFQLNAYTKYISFISLNVCVDIILRMIFLCYNYLSQVKYNIFNKKTIHMLGNASWFIVWKDNQRYTSWLTRKMLAERERKKTTVSSKLASSLLLFVEKRKKKFFSKPEKSQHNHHNNVGAL